MKIIVFYDNFVRDYRSLLLLSEILKTLGHKANLLPLWQGAIEKIKRIKPDAIVMGQVGEYTTSQIGTFCYENGIHVIINTSEIVSYQNRLKNFFSLNFKTTNESLVSLQTIPNKDLQAIANDIISKKNIQKYKLVGFPRFDLAIDASFKNVETEKIIKKYNLQNKKKKFLYISSLIYDEEGGQVSKENEDDINEQKMIAKEKRTKKQHTEILKKLCLNYLKKDDVLLIKKHPWDKSDFFDSTFGKDKLLKNKCIVLEKNEYILPIIEISDYLLHAESTVAIEGWLLGKKTISILPKNNTAPLNKNTLMNHMKYETVVETYEELIDTIQNYPPEPVGAKYLKTFASTLDGKTTIRLAKEINKLTPKPNKTILQKPRTKIKHKIMKPIQTIILTLRNKRPSLTGYAAHLLEMEKDKKNVKKIYLPQIKKYIKQHKEYLESK